MDKSATDSLVRSARPLDRGAMLLLVLLCASWGVQQVLVKLALAEVPPITQAAIRSVGGTLLIGAWAWWREPRIFRHDHTFWPGVIAGALFAAEFLVLFVGLQWTSASHAVVYIYTAPFFVALGAVLVLPGERLVAVQWLGLVLSFVGVAIALGFSTGGQDSSLLGDLFTLAGGAFWGATTVLIKATSLRSAPATKVLLYQLVVSGILLVAAAVAVGEKLPTTLSLLALSSLAYQAIWVAGFTFLAWFWLLRLYHSGEMSAFTFLTPVIGVLAGHFILGDRLDGGFLFAVVLVTAGIVLVNWPRGT
jgi:drug/metabolite transporter (DMT)-like permease